MEYFSYTPTAVTTTEKYSRSHSTLTIVTDESSNVLHRFPDKGASIGSNFPTIVIPILSDAATLVLPRISGTSTRQVDAPVYTTQPIRAIARDNITEPGTRKRTVDDARATTADTYAAHNSNPGTGRGTRSRATVDAAVNAGVPRVLSTVHYAKTLRLYTSYAGPVVYTDAISLPAFITQCHDSPIPLVITPIARLPIYFAANVSSPMVVSSSATSRPTVAAPSAKDYSPKQVTVVSPATAYSAKVSSSVSPHAAQTFFNYGPTGTHVTSPMPAQTHTSDG